MQEFFRLMLVGLVLGGLAALPLTHASEPLPPPAIMASISPADLRAHEQFLASIELGGRYVASPSVRIAARYLASRLRSYGFSGRGDEGDFFQRFMLADTLNRTQGAQLVLASKSTELVFESGKDLWLQPESRAGQWNSELVFARYGVTLLEAGYDDYASIDAKGKIVVIVDGFPASLRHTPYQSERSYPLLLKQHNASSHGAVALLVVTDHPKESSEGTARQTAGSETLVLQDDLEKKRTLPVIQLDLSASQAALADTEVSLDRALRSTDPPASQTLGKRATLEVSATEKLYPAANVVGVLEGSDPKLKHEFVLFSAHYDHLRSIPGRVYRGADDDGSGTAAVLEIAEAFSLGPRPRRSILIVFHTGEEEGLLGSSYYVSHPTIPLSSIVADFNIDMIGRTRTVRDIDPRDAELSDQNSLYLIGSDKLSTELHRISEETNRETEHFSLDYRYNSPEHPERLYYRSDHWNYAKNRIPVIFYFTGLHQDYHQPTDTPDKIDFEKMTRITRFIFATGWRVANLDHRIAVDHEGDQEGPN